MIRSAQLGYCRAAIGVVVLLVARASFAQEQAVTSPDGTVQVTFALRYGVPTYAISRFGSPLVSESRLGFELVDAPPLDRNFELASMKRCSLSETWTQPWGERKDILNEYNELRLALRQKDDLARELVVVFRVFDNGVGFRYEWPEQPNLKDIAIQDELTEFVLAADGRAWWIPAYEPEHYEYLYRNTPVSELKKAHTPATFAMPNGIYLSIHEAALTDFASMTLTGSGGTKLKADLVQWSDGVRARVAAPVHTPWRTIQIGDNPGELITSYLILNLNEPCALKDTSWIKPGKYVGIWWEMHLGKSTWAAGEKHGATTANTKRYVDFASENGFDGVLVEGWNQGWDGDWIKNGDKFNFTEPYSDYDLAELAAYAESKGVSLIGHHETGGAVPNYERQLDAAYSLCERLGLRAVKTGYVDFANGLDRVDADGKPAGEWHYGQYMVRHHQRVIDEAARHRVMLDVHEPVKPTGLCRTYPNLMTGEGARGQEYNAWAADGGNPPEHETILPFTRLLAGPMDFTPGIFDLTYPELRPNNRVNTTLAKQLALYVVLYSPLQMAADLPENYAAAPEAFQFIRDVPTNWDETRVVDAQIGDYVTIVRKERDGDDWYLGSVTDEVGRTLDVPLSFLDRQRRYVAEIYRDADDADWKTNPTAHKVDEREVDANTVLQVRLAPGGGQAIRFRPLDD
jgi:alpha-glucosidase